MERLTERFANGEVGVFGCGNNCKYEYKYCYNRSEDCPTFNEMYEKLAAYEDTNVEPEEILTGAQLAEIACMQIQYNKMQELLERAAEEIESYYGMETELTEAMRKQLT